MALPKAILVATDFSEHADHALESAVELAAQLDATLHLVHAITIPLLGMSELGFAYSALTIDDMTKRAQDALDSRLAKYRGRVTLAPGRLEVGDARDVIDRTAEEIGADLIIIGTHGRRGVRRILLGSVAESVVRSAPCPVMTVRQ